MEYADGVTFHGPTFPFPVSPTWYNMQRRWLCIISSTVIHEATCQDKERK